MSTRAQQIVFQEYVRAVTEQLERLQRLERELLDEAKGWRLRPVVEAIQALRGIDVTGATILIAEVGDLTRFDTARKLMSYLGLTPSEILLGERRRQGGITKDGERACSARASGRRVGLSVSSEGEPTSAAPTGEASGETSKPLGGRPRCACVSEWQLTARGKHVNQVVVAIAREMAAFAWAIARTVPVASKS